MNKPYQDTNLLDFQKRYQTEKIVGKSSLNFVGLKASFLLVVDIENTILSGDSKSLID